MVLDLLYTYAHYATILVFVMFFGTEVRIGKRHVAVGQNLRYLFGDEYPPMVVSLNDFWMSAAALGWVK